MIVLGCYIQMHRNERITFHWCALQVYKYYDDYKSINVYIQYIYGDIAQHMDMKNHHIYCIHLAVSRTFTHCQRTDPCMLLCTTKYWYISTKITTTAAAAARNTGQFSEFSLALFWLGMSFEALEICYMQYSRLFSDTTLQQ